MSIIKSARIGQYKGKYIHSTVNATTESIIREAARNVTQIANDYERIEDSLRSQLKAKLGGSWLVIVTSAAPNYASDWDISLGITYAMEFDLGSLRFFVYHRTA